MLMSMSWRLTSGCQTPWRCPPAWAHPWSGCSWRRTAVGLQCGSAPWQPPHVHPAVKWQEWCFMRVINSYSAGWFFEVFIFVEQWEYYTLILTETVMKYHVSVDCQESYIFPRDYIVPRENITILAPPTRDISTVPVDFCYIRWSKWMISSKYFVLYD